LDVIVTVVFGLNPVPLTLIDCPAVGFDGVTVMVAALLLTLMAVDAVLLPAAHVAQLALIVCDPAEAPAGTVTTVDGRLPAPSEVTVASVVAGLSKVIVTL
jgi:hypothetical protein